MVCKVLAAKVQEMQEGLKGKFTNLNFQKGTYCCPFNFVA